MFLACVVVSVDKKETAAGLDPEKELMNSRFHDII